MDTASFSLQSTWVCGRSLLSQRLNPCGLFLICSAVRNVAVLRLKSYCKLNKQQFLVPSTDEIVESVESQNNQVHLKQFRSGSVQQQSPTHFTHQTGPATKPIPAHKLWTPKSILRPKIFKASSHLDHAQHSCHSRAISHQRHHAQPPITQST
ncbi:hypothetical protein AKJ16_DCAP15705 [Drosera capensis]